MGEELRRLIRSGFIEDTLFQITGEPSEVRPMTQGEMRTRPNKVGHFDHNRDEVAVAPDQSREGLTRTLSHEAGHRLLDSLIQKDRRGELTPEEAEVLRSLPQGLQQLQQVENPSHAQQYAASNMREHFAVAFQRALQALRTPEEEGRQDSIQSAEREIPGVKAVADFLLGRSPFSR